MRTFLGGTPQTIGGRIFWVRVSNGLTQGVFAQYLGVSRQDVTDYEHAAILGERKSRGNEGY